LSSALPDRAGWIGWRIKQLSERTIFMCTNKMLFSAALFCGLAACLANPARALADANEDKLAVEAINTQFYAALNALFAGDVAPMEQVWSHADDVSYMGPVGGRQIGWTQVLANWQQQAALKLDGSVAPTGTRVTLGNDLAFVECDEVATDLQPNREDVAATIRSTSIFRKENGQWKMIGHHTDPIPALEEGEAGPAVLIEEVE
jgi:ketosteroid isomerase-like protein